MRWRHWFGAERPTRDERAQDLDREIRAHLELEAEEQQDSGLAAAEARDVARRAFGNRTLIREEIAATWGLPALDALRLDIRYAWRTMRRAPGFAAMAVGSSALGIGACAIIFAVIAVALLPRLPVDEPARLLSLSEQNGRTGDEGNQLSYPDVRDVRQARAFEGIAAADPLVPATIADTSGTPGDPQRHWGALVTANYFAVVRPRFAIGRGFDAGRDDHPGEPPVIVLSHHLWQTRFQGDPAIIGRTLTINGRAATVIGVTDAGFRGTQAAIVSDFWIPFSMLAELESRKGRFSENRERHWLDAVARLRPGVTPQEAHAELDIIAHALNATYGPRDSDGARKNDGAANSNNANKNANSGTGSARTFHLEPAGQIHPSLRRAALTLFSLLLGATMLVLLTACANVANLLLGRASARRREIAARMALGASRGRLIRQLVTESLMLALLGGIGGWLLAAGGAWLIGRLRVPLAWPIDLTVSLDARVLLFAIALSIATGLIFGLVPALRATRPDLVTDLKSDGRGIASSGGGAARFGLRHGLVVAQVAICTVLLLGTGLFLRSLAATRDIDLGIGPRNLLLMAVDPSLDHRSDPQARRLLRDILERASATPGVESATLTTAVPLTLIIDNSRFVADDHSADPARAHVSADIYNVAPRFFETMGMAWMEGRDFALDPAGAGEAIAIVNDAFARAVLPGESAIGRRFVGDGKQLRVVGVVATAKSRTIGEAPRPSIYLPIFDVYTGGQSIVGVTLAVRTRDAAATYAGSLREAIRRADPSLAVFDVRTMERHVSDALIVPRLAGTLAVMAGVIGLAIATIGVYGVISFAVARRRREIGVRLAIGARPGEILAMMLTQGIALAACGVVLGVIGGLSLAGFVASLLYGVTPRDTLTFIAVPAFLMLIALVACLVPARSASRLDPVTVLRSE
jgi:predicted permease